MGGLALFVFPVNVVSKIYGHRVCTFDVLLDFGIRCSFACLKVLKL